MTETYLTIIASLAFLLSFIAGHSYTKKFCKCKQYSDEKSEGLALGVAYLIAIVCTIVATAIAVRI